MVDFGLIQSRTKSIVAFHPSLCVYFAGPTLSTWIFRGSEIFSREYFVGPIFFLMTNFVIQRFWISSQPIKVSLLLILNITFCSSISIVNFEHVTAGWMAARERVTEMRNSEKKSQTTYSFLHWFQQWSIVYGRKVIHLINYLRYGAAFITTNRTTCTKLVWNGTFTGIFSIKDMKTCAKQHKKLKITKNIQICH